MGDSPSNRLHLRSNYNIIARNQTLRDDGQAYCMGSYYDERGQITACDINMAPENEEEEDLSFMEYIESLWDSPDNYPDQCLEILDRDKIENYYRMYCTPGHCSATGTNDFLAQHYTVVSPDGTVSTTQNCINVDLCPDDDENCDEETRAQSCNAVEGCSYNEAVDRWPARDRIQLDLDVPGSDIFDIHIDTSLEEIDEYIEGVDLPTGPDGQTIYGCTNIKEYIEATENLPRCLKDKDTTPGDYDRTNNIKTKEECLLRYPNGYWCSYCDAHNHVQSMMQPRLEFDLEAAAAGNLEQALPDTSWQYMPAQGCIYHRGGISEDLKQIAHGIVCAETAVEAQIRTELGQLGNHVHSLADDFIPGSGGSIMNVYDDAGDVVQDVGNVIENLDVGQLITSVLQNCGIAQAEHDLEKQLANWATCSQTAATAIDIGSMILDATGVGMIAGIPLHIASNAVGQCALETQEIIDLHGSCPNGYRDCPKYIFCEAGDTDCTETTKYDEYDSYGNKRSPIGLEECGDFATSGTTIDEKCKACTPIKNAKGLLPGDRGRDISANLDLYALSDNDHLDSFNKYFCIDNQATRVFRPPPAALFSSLAHQFQGEEEIDSIGNSISGMLDTADEYYEEARSNDALCNVGHYLGNAAEGVMDVGDGQGFDRNTCGTRKVSYTDINPCKEGYRISGPKHLNPLADYSRNPCVYLDTQEECNNYHTREIEPNTSPPDSRLRGRIANQICKWNEGESYCDLDDTQFESNYCCKSIPGSEECPFAPIDAWSKFNFASIRFGNELFDNNEGNLNLSMIQTGETCSYEGNPTNDIYCNYTDESLSTTNPVPEPVRIRETTNDIVARFGGGVTSADRIAAYLNPVVDVAETVATVEVGAVSGVVAGESGSEVAAGASETVSSGVDTVAQDIDAISTGYWIAPNTSSGYNDDGTKQRDGTRFLLKGHVKSEFTTDEILRSNPDKIWSPSSQPPPTSEMPTNPTEISEYGYSKEDLDHKFCRNTKTHSKYRTSYSEEVNDYGTSRIYCKDFNPRDPLSDSQEPYFVSKLPCLNAGKWATLTYHGTTIPHDYTDCSQFGSPQSSSPCPTIPVEGDEKNRSNCVWAPPIDIKRSDEESESSPGPICRKDPDAKTLIYTSYEKDLDGNKEEIGHFLNELGWEQPFQGISLEKAEEIISNPKNRNRSCDFDSKITCELNGGSWNEGQKMCTNVPGCSYLTDYLYGSTDVYRTWTAMESDVNLLQAVEGLPFYGVCDIKTVMDMYDQDKHFYRTNPTLDPNSSFSDMCCNSDDSCTEIEDDQKCKINDEPIYKTLLDPKSIDEFIEDRRDELKNSQYHQVLDGIENYFTNIFSQDPPASSSPSPSSPPPTSIYDLPIENYKYNITNKDSCDSSYGAWVPDAPGGPKCYEIYKTENLDGSVHEHVSSLEECEGDGYGKWLTDTPDGAKCVRLNKNKSDCLLSGGVWNPTDDDYNPSVNTSDSHDDILCPPQLTAASKLALHFLNEEDTSSMSLEELEEKEELIKKTEQCVKATGLNPVCPIGIGESYSERKKQTDNIHFIIIISTLLLNFLIMSISYGERYDKGPLGLIRDLMKPSVSKERSIYMLCFIIASHSIFIQNGSGINKFKTLFDDSQIYSMTTAISIMSVVGLSLGIISDEGFGMSIGLFIGSLIAGGIGGFFIHSEFKDRTHMKIQEYHEYFSLLYPIGIIITLLFSFAVKKIGSKLKKKE